MRVDDKTVAIDDVVCTKETPKALFIEPAGVDDSQKLGLWIPKSQVHPTSQINIQGDVGVLVVSEWLYNQKKLEVGKEDCWTHFGGVDKRGEKNE